MNLTKFSTMIPVILATALFGLQAPAYAVAEHPAPAPAAAATAQTDAALRDLWMGHVFWVRNVVVETLAHNQSAAAEAEKEVVANAKQIAAAIEPFYGKPASDKLFQLLAGHYGAVKQYLEATIAGSTAKQDAATKALTDNAAEIARFLSGANPNLPYDAVNGLLMAHGAHHIAQIQELAAKNYAAEANTWGAMKHHMYAIADALTGAISTQFPDKFVAQAK
jgi:hypothetical protein